MTDTPCHHAVNGCSSPAVKTVQLAHGCVVFPGVREQALCLQHLARLSALEESPTPRRQS